MNETLQREIDDLAPAVKAWDQRGRALDFVLRCGPMEIDVALIEWVTASKELVAARIELAGMTDARRQFERLEVAS